MNPSTRILLYLISALALPGLSFFVLLPLLVAACLLSWREAHALWRLVSRAKWLFAMIVLGYAYTSPGQAVYPGLAEFSPTREGVAVGGTQALRLLLLLVLLHLLVLRLPMERVLSGFYRLMWPFRVVGLSVASTTLRLALTLRAMETSDGVKQGLIERLRDAEGLAPGLEEYELTIEARYWLDYLVLALALLGMMGIWLRASL